MNKLLVLKYIFSSSDSFATVDKMNGINHPLLYKRFSVVTLLQGIFTILLRRVFKFIPATRVWLSERVAFAFHRNFEFMFFWCTQFVNVRKFKALLMPHYRFEIHKVWRLWQGLSLSTIHRAFRMYLELNSKGGMSKWTNPIQSITKQNTILWTKTNHRLPFFGN